MIGHQVPSIPGNRNEGIVHRFRIWKGDFRFLMCLGKALIAPGVPQWNAELAKKYGSRILDGTGDLIATEEQLRFKRAAHAYAESYNARLWSRTEAKR